MPSLQQKRLSFSFTTTPPCLLHQCGRWLSDPAKITARNWALMLASRISSDKLRPTKTWIIHALSGRNLLNFNSIAAEKGRFSHFIVIAFSDFFPTLSLKFNSIL